jgi:uncharacterized protein
MLEMRPGCECCDTDLPPSSTEALICSFECTFCRACANRLDGLCPNCGGALTARPTRPVTLLDKYPAVVQRTHNPQTCAPT